jgi:hypothetical protein
MVRKFINSTQDDERCAAWSPVMKIADDINEATDEDASNKDGDCSSDLPPKFDNATFSDSDTENDTTTLVLERNVVTCTTKKIMNTSAVEVMQFDLVEVLVLPCSSNGFVKLWDLEEAKVVCWVNYHASGTVAVLCLQH